MKASLIFLIFFTVSVSSSFAQTRVADLSVANDPRGEVELVVCSFNLQNYGHYKDVKLRERLKPEEYADKETAIVHRILRAGCDVVGVQEVLGKTKVDAEDALKVIAERLRKATNRFYEVIVGPTNDSRSRVGYIFATDRVQITNRVSYVNVELPKIDPKQRQRLFARGPLEVQMTVIPKGDAHAKRLTLINFHFKSKSTKGGMDPSGLDFEPYRMEMSEAVNRIVEARHSEALTKGETILLLLGDRNSNRDSASARILEGTLSLRDFQAGGRCRLSSRGVPLCKPKTASAQRFFSVITTNPKTKTLKGTIKYKGAYSWIDDILAPQESLPFLWSSAHTEGIYSSGLQYEPEYASDHALVWAGLNW